jgi:retron-type reverse transcriptase
METMPSVKPEAFIIKTMQLEIFRDIDIGVLTEEIFSAYYDCRKNKRNTINALAFEKYMEANLFGLVQDVYQGNYTLGRSICFMVNKPVKREIFAADFRDRVMHHWLINKLNPFFEQEFIIDSYACRVGKGTHYGIQRVYSFMQSCSDNYTRDCYILKLDIRGFFMHIHRASLMRKLEKFVCKIYKASDMALVLEIASKIIFNDPTQNCIIKGSRNDWVGLPPDKSLFHSTIGFGLPIGNLTSQVFANFYMNDFDQYVKNELGIQHYGRYVDDFILIHSDKSYLKSLIPKLRGFLAEHLHLTLHSKKIYLQHYSCGVKFLGTVIKPNRIYIANRTKGNFYNAVQKQNILVRERKPDKEEKEYFLSVVNSYLGIMKHYRTYNIRKKIIKKMLSAYWWNHVYVSSGYSKVILKSRPRSAKYQ